MLRNPHRVRRRILRTLAVLAVLAAVGTWMFLRVGQWLVVEDPLAPSGAAVVLSGGLPMRAREAAEIYREKFTPEVWVTHGREEALIHAAATRGIKGRALRLMGYGEEDEAEDAVESGTVPC